MPGSKQAWPNRAACWSPAMPDTGMPAGAPLPSTVTPTRPLDGRTSGRAPTGTPSRAASSSLHARRPMSKSIVRLAFDGSVACTAPPVSCQRTHASMVPRARSGPAGTPPSVEQPRHLGGREVRVEHQPGALAHERQMAGGGQLVAALRRAAVLPHDGAVQRPPGAPVPSHHRLALVGDADGGDRPVQLGDYGRQRGPHGVGDVVGVVLDPARLREVLRELPVRRRPHGAGVVEGEGCGHRSCRRRRRSRRPSTAAAASAGWSWPCGLVALVRLVGRRLGRLAGRRPRRGPSPFAAAPAGGPALGRGGGDGGALLARLEHRWVPAELHHDDGQARVDRAAGDDADEAGRAGTRRRATRTSTTATTAYSDERRQHLLPGHPATRVPCHGHVR